jgi:thiol-disulfide isomerase/thioredoxin
MRLLFAKNKITWHLSLFLHTAKTLAHISKEKALLLLLIFLSASVLHARPAFCEVDLFSQDGVCSQDSESTVDCPETPEKINGNNHIRIPAPAPENVPLPKVPYPPNEKVLLYFFWGDGCPHCHAEKAFLEEIVKNFPLLEIRDYEVWYNTQNADMFSQMSRAYHVQSSSVPMTFIGDRAILGFSEQAKEELVAAILKCSSEQCPDPDSILSGKVKIGQLPLPGEARETLVTSDDLECTEKSKTVYIPWLGNLDASEMSLPVITIVIALLDSFNPCAFFILFSLLGLLIHANSRGKMMLIGGVFVFFSGFVYFLFMAAWLNLFLVLGKVGVLTLIAGTFAIVIAMINIKDFFLFKKGVSLSIPDHAKPKLFDRMRKLLKSSSYVSILFGTVVLAVAANAYELLCTAGFPMVFARILTLHTLSPLSYYLYLLLYNIVYVIPLLLIVILFTVTLGRRILTEWQGRVLKLVSGTLMLGLGLVLLIDPSILSNTLISFFILCASFLISGAVALITRKFLGKQ